MTDKDKARRTRMRFEIETAISNGGSAEDLEKAVDRIIAIHEANKPKPEPFCYISENTGECVLPHELPEDLKISGRWKPLYTTPPTREPLNETIIECIGYKYGFGTLEGSIEFTWYNSETIDFARGIEQAHGIGTPQTTT